MSTTLEVLSLMAMGFAVGWLLIAPVMVLVALDSIEEKLDWLIERYRESMDDPDGDDDPPDGDGEPLPERGVVVAALGRRAA